MNKVVSYAYFRLPYSDGFTVIKSACKPTMLAGYGDVGSEEGFVIAPFAVGGDTPIVLIKPDSVETFPVVHTETETPSECSPAAPDDIYRDSFEAFHSAVAGGRFKKLVLFRTKIVATDGRLTPQDMFISACQRYPRLMIMLFSTPQTGTWLVASPEILFDNDGTTCRTMALAGTMPYRDGYTEWSMKNREEQQIVERYIENAISPLSRQMLKDGPATSRAGNLLHLRTDFRFRLAEGKGVGDIVSRLHPTPAVCGIPTAEAREFILSTEPSPRRYYSGFAGPVGIGGETHLYVSLRCTEIRGEECVLYAGGGIMPDSTCESEWQETESKMKTISQCIAIKRM